MNIKFYKKEKLWYADLPDYIAAGGTEDECEMVAGADTWLDMLAEGNDEVTLDLSETGGDEKIDFYSSDEFGATYLVYEKDGYSVNHMMWLCNVTKFVFGEFPEIIYYTKLR